MRKGFVLIELLVIIFIISLFFGISFVQMSAFTKDNIDSDGKALISLLEYLNEEAIMKKQELELKIDLKEKTLSFLDEKRQRQIEIKTLQNIFIQQKGTSSEGEVIIFFSPDGFQERIKFYLVDKNKDLEVVLNPISNRVTIEGKSDNEIQKTL